MHIATGRSKSVNLGSVDYQDKRGCSRNGFELQSVHFGPEKV